jgi:hypothetical protein
VFFQSIEYAKLIIQMTIDTSESFLSLKTDWINYLHHRFHNDRISKLLEITQTRKYFERRGKPGAENYKPDKKTNA